MNARPLIVALLLALPAAAAPHAETVAGEFFIVSSIDPAKNQLLLKQPTEVTEVIRVSDTTKYFDKAGKALELKDLRAGDTVFITRRPGTNEAIEIRKGPMTVAELQRRYLRK